MKMYADRLPTAVRQLLTDLLVVFWVYAWIRAGIWVNDMVEKLGVPGQKLQEAGSGIAGNMSDIGGKVGRVPLVGDELTAPFNSAADAANQLAEAGRQQQEIVDNLALTMALLIIAVPLGLVLFLWLPLRLRWMRRAAVARRVSSEPAGQDLLALRALATRPLNELSKLGPDIAQSWRNGDASAVQALAALELKDLGLRTAKQR
ncbi:hypothetical protein AFR_08065 [Actinoplanes friuliensis DSM 7358]|uniref:Transmembrane protein n=2 Tax=Actinoplanes friuliensis TaxID=196914 RepID=U5VSV9_9ACTN|nr:hypothetical protein AFR_08065 [Actinoplanes friuliensis DSM 7358]